MNAIYNVYKFTHHSSHITPLCQMSRVKSQDSRHIIYNICRIFYLHHKNNFIFIEMDLDLDFFLFYNL
jgi:glycine cleavage system regulatory protein